MSLDKQVKQLAKQMSKVAQSRTIPASVDVFNTQGWAEALAKWDNLNQSK